MRDRTGPNNSNWKGGRITDPRGYILLRRPDHPRADVRGYVYEHIVKAEEVAGRAILSSEQVHHGDETKGHNEPDNLVVTGSLADHAVYHRSPEGRLRLRHPGEPNHLMFCRCGCGKMFLRYDKSGRPRLVISGHNGRKTKKEL